MTARHLIAIPILSHDEYIRWLDQEKADKEARERRGRRREKRPKAAARDDPSS